MLVFLVCFIVVLFPLSFLAATILLVVLITQLKKITNDYFEITILYIGEISMILFVVNGPFRSYPLFDVDASLKFERMFLYMLLLFILCHVLYLLYSFLAKRLRI